MKKSNGLDGLIILNKPMHLSSARALYRIRGVTGQRKSGHAGTLDPMASGVLILCLGKATKLVEKLMDLPKVYRATARLDVTSASFDCETEMVPVNIADQPVQAAVERICASFEGVHQQVPPLTSAVKIAGQPAYKMARANQPIALQPRPVRIYWIHIHSFAWPALDLEICCGRGTYVRSLIRDIGTALRVGGCLTSLIRTRVGPFLLQDSWKHEQIEQSTTTGDYLIDLEQAKSMIERTAHEIPPRPQTAASR